MATYYEYNSVTGFLIGTYEVPPEIVRPNSTLVDYAPIPPNRARWTGIAWVNDPAQEAAAAGAATLYAQQAWSGIVPVLLPVLVSAAGALSPEFVSIITNAASATYTLPVAPPSGTTMLIGTAKFATVGAAQATLDAGVGVIVANHTRFLVLTHENFVLLRWSGTQWLALALDLNSPWVDGGVITIGATTLAPTKGVTSRDKYWWSRVDQDVLVRYEYRQTGAGVNGTGDYLFSLPFSANTGLALATTAANNFDMFATTLGPARYLRAADSIIGAASLYDATRFRMSGLHVGSPVATSDNSPVNAAIGLNNANVAFSASVRVPVLNW